VEATLVRPRQRIEIVQERPHAVAHDVTVDLEGAIGDVGAREASALGALDQVDERFFPLALDDRIDRPFAYGALGRRADVRSTENDGNVAQSLHGARDRYRPRVR